MRHVVWFSCGVASAVLAKMVSERHKCAIVYCDLLKDEHTDNIRFLMDCEQWIGQPIETIKSEKYNSIDDVFEQTRYMSGVSGARCTTEMKKLPRRHFENHDDTHHFGLTAEEHKRIANFEQNNPELRCEWLLRDGFITKKRCHDIIRAAGIETPAMYKLGYKNNNCIGCVKATSVRYWNMIRRDFPDIFDERAKRARDLGVRLARYKGERVFIEDLPPDAMIGDLEDISCGPDCGQLSLLSNKT